MGFASDMIRGVRGSDCLGFVEVAYDMEREQDQWIAELRSKGVKAAHPDDGWVDRERNTVQMVYPGFDDGAGIGDVIALGCPQWGSKHINHRLVRIVGQEVRPFTKRWAFEQLE